jgi:TonB-dependent receptor
MSRFYFSFLPSILFLLILLFPRAIYAQGEGIITGKITDASTSEALPGANILLDGTNFGVSSDRFGLYKIENIPFGIYTMIIKYMGYNDYKVDVELTQSRDEKVIDANLESTAIELSDVLVSGLRQGQLKALNQQLMAQEIKNILSKEEMEKFPDMNTAEALQRLPGVSISRNLGEGAFVFVRGTEPRLTSVTVDGQKLSSSEDAIRTTNLGIINVDQLSSIEVTKALTPDMDANGVGGQVNLVTKSPFDYEKPTLKLDLGGGYSTQGKEPLYRASASYTGFIGEEKKLGFAITGNFYQNNIDARESNSSWDVVRDVNRRILNTDGDSLHFSSFDLNFRRSRRDRYGLSGVLEYKMDKYNSFYVRGIYNLRKEELTIYNHYYRMGDGIWFSDNNLQSSRMDYTMINQKTNTSLSTAAIGGKHEFGGLNFDYDFYYSYADQVRPERFRSEWAIDKRVSYIINLSNPDYPQFQMTDTDKDADYISNPANYIIDTQEWKFSNSNNENFSGVMNASIPYNLFGIPAELKGGVKYNRDVKVRNKAVAGLMPWEARPIIGDARGWKGGGKPTMDQIASDEIISGFLNQYTFSPIINVDVARGFMNANKCLIPGLGPCDVIDYRSSYGSTAGGDDIGGFYDNVEEIYAVYLMTNFSMSAILSVLTGIRDEYSITRYIGNSLIFDSDGSVGKVFLDTSKSQYNNIFPYLHLKYKLTNMTNIRLAFTQTIARADFYDLAPYYIWEPKDRTLVEGNPDLEPSLSSNIDFMVEHFFEGIGIASIGLFYKNIDKLIYQRDWFQMGGEYDGFARSKPVNAGSSELWGFEINWMQQFNFLPGFLSGFGIYANYTKTKSKADLEFRDWTVIPGQAGDIGNIGLSYEKYGLTLRFSANFHSPLLVGVGDSPKFDTYSDTYKRFDFAGVYQIFRNLSVFFNIMNITDERDRKYMGVSNRPTNVEFYGISMDSGIKFTL